MTDRRLWFKEEVVVSPRVAHANTRIARGHIAEYLALARENAQRAARSGDEALRALTYFEVATAEGFAGNLGECERAFADFFRSTPGSVVFDAAMIPGGVRPRAAGRCRAADGGGGFNERRHA